MKKLKKILLTAVLLLALLNASSNVAQTNTNTPPLVNMTTVIGWNAPTNYVGGVPLPASDILGYTFAISKDTNSANMLRTYFVSGAATTNAVMSRIGTNLSGIHQVWVNVVTKQSATSEWTGPLSVLINPPPESPTNLKIVK